MLLKTIIFFFLLITFIYTGSYGNFKIIFTVVVSLLPFLDLKRFFFFKSPNRMYLLLIFWLVYFGLSLLVGINSGFPYPNIRFIYRWFILLPMAFSIGHLIYRIFDLKEMHKLLEKITFIILIMSAVFYFLELHGLTSNFRFLFPINSFSGLRAYTETLSLRAANQASLVFLLPFNIFNFHLNEKNLKNFPYLSFFNVFFGLFISVLGGRRILQYSVFLILINLVIVSLINTFKKGTFNIRLIKDFFFLKYKFVFRLVLFGFIGFLIFYILFTLQKIFSGDSLIQAYLSTLFAPFDFQQDEGSIIRISQNNALFDGWLKAPLFGHGLTSYSKDFFRSLTTPWSYETFYTALLFQAGIVGLFVFISTIYGTLFGFKIPLFLNLSKEKKLFYLMPISLIIFFIGCGTNPFWDNVAIWSLLFYSGLNLKDLKD